MSRGQRRRRYTIGDVEWMLMVASTGSKCLKCGRTGRMTKDHVRPLCRGGGTGLSNLQPLCFECNQEKGIQEQDYRPRGIVAHVQHLFARTPSAPRRARPLTYRLGDNGVSEQLLRAAVAPGWKRWVRKVWRWLTS